MAGAGMDRGVASGPLSNYLPAVRPARRGAVSADGDLAHNASRIDILYVPRTRSQTSLLTTMASAGSDLTLNTAQAGCQAGTPCGFATGNRALVVDTSAVGAGYEVFTVTGTTLTTLAHAAPNLAFAKAYPQDSTMVSQIEEHVYYLDPQTNQLKHYDGHQGDEILVDDVAALQFTYFADPDPLSAPRPPVGLSNCVYDVGDVPKLANLGGTTLKALTPAQLTDGPICGIGTNRFDGDLLRVRKVRVSIRVQSAKAELREKDANTPGAKLATQLVPDYTMTFEVSPRNLNLIR
jgi:hypothetical protein